jgi:ABC-2 type transport system ATP-binding protein
MTSTHPAPVIADSRTPGAAVVVEGLTKRFGERAAVGDLDFDVPAGSLTGFIGPNGAGKTTTLRMLVGLVSPTAGGGEVLGQPLTSPERYLSRVGALIEAPGFYPGLSGEHNLRVLAAAAGLDATSIPQLLDRVGLAGRGGDAYKAYSLGMKQRLGIAAALLGDPELLILDEPANGLDPQGMRDMRVLLTKLHSEGHTVLVSSHLLGELEQICDWLVVINNGGLLYQGTPDTLAGDEYLTLRPEHHHDLATLAELVGHAGLRPTADRRQLAIPFPDANKRLNEIAGIARAAASAGITLVEITPHKTHLEQSYLNLIGQPR